MKKLTREEVKDLVIKIRRGEGSDEEFSKWIEMISFSTVNPNVIKCIMSGRNATIEEIMEKLYNYKPILL